MELTHWQYMGALGGVIGIGWLVVVPMYRGWKPLNERMSERVRESTTLLSTLSESEGARPESRSSLSASSTRSYGISIR